jgi:hypothetical protein
VLLVAASEFWVDAEKKYDLNFKEGAEVPHQKLTAPELQVGNFFIMFVIFILFYFVVFVFNKNLFIDIIFLQQLYQSFCVGHPMVSIEDPFDQVVAYLFVYYYVYVYCYITYLNMFIPTFFLNIF